MYMGVLKRKFTSIKNWINHKTNKKVYHNYSNCIIGLLFWVVKKCYRKWLNIFWLGFWITYIELIKEKRIFRIKCECVIFPHLPCGPGSPKLSQSKLIVVVMFFHVCLSKLQFWILFGATNTLMRLGACPFLLIFVVWSKRVW